MKTWSAKQLRSFLEGTTNDRLAPLWRVLAMTGMRRGEVCGLRWEDVDLEGSRLSVRRALIPHGDGVIVAEPKTARGRRSIALDELTLEACKTQAARQLTDRENAEVAWTETGYVFTRDDGEPLHPQSVSRAFERAITAAKLPRIRLHDLRHTHASLALAAGINPKVVPLRAAGPRDRLHHPRHLLTRHPSAAEGGCGENRRASIRHDVHHYEQRRMMSARLD